VDQPAQRPGGERRQDRPGNRHAMLEAIGQHAGRQAHDRGDREIDLAIDDQEGHGQRDDDLFDLELEQIHDIADAEIDRRARQAERHDDDQEAEQQALPAAQPAQRRSGDHGSPPARAGGGLAISFISVRAHKARSRCRMTASLDTASRISRPSSASRQNSLICRRKRLCSKVPIMMAPSMAPITVPEPPKMLTPPTTTAATTWSSSPRPFSTVMLPKRARVMKPARPASAPGRTKAAKTMRRASRPIRWAASGLEPMA